MKGIVAKNIYKLVDYLKSTHLPGDLYRGQVRDYPVLVPSLFRSLVYDLSDGQEYTRLIHSNFERLLKNSKQARMKFRLQASLIGEFGLGLGNILAQQYGLGSETIDVTENIDVAAYFATRKYPEYSHFGGDGQGVIYRFRGLESDDLGTHFSLDDLDFHFEMGRSADGYFDFFVSEDKKRHVFERDKWWEYEKGISSEVWTLRFVSSHAVIRSIAEEKIVEKLNSMEGIRSAYINGFNWENTRFFSQDGGLIRPRIYWNSLIPSKYDLAGSIFDVQRIRSFTGNGVASLLFDRRYDKNPNLIKKLPIVIPSAAIKKNISGIENLRANPKCAAFLFNHSDKRVTGFYRSGLWPEPSEDPFYGLFWWRSTSIIMSEYDAREIPPINDPKLGVLDRGYFEEDEVIAMDGRTDEDLLKGILKDARENIQFGLPTNIDYIKEATALLSQKAFREATCAVIAGLRKHNNDLTLLLMLSSCFENLGKWLWSEKSIEYAFRLYPKNDITLYFKSIALTRNGSFNLAAMHLDQAIDFFDIRTSTLHEYELLGHRCILACLLGDLTTVRKLYKQLTQWKSDLSEISEEISALKELFPEEAQKAIDISKIFHYNKQ